jgi:hypothetical protein
MIDVSGFEHGLINFIPTGHIRSYPPILIHAARTWSHKMKVGIPRRLVDQSVVEAAGFEHGLISFVLIGHIRKLNSIIATTN